MVNGHRKNACPNMDRCVKLYSFANVQFYNIRIYMFYSNIQRSLIYDDFVCDLCY